MSTRGYWAMSRDTFDCHSWGRGATGISWLEAKDAANHRTLRSTTQTAKCSLVQHVSRTEVEEIRIRGKEKRRWWRHLGRCLRCAPCWESGGPVSSRRIMLKMRMVKRVTAMIPLAHPAGGGGPPSFPLRPSDNLDLHYGRGHHSPQA